MTLQNILVNGNPENIFLIFETMLYTINYYNSRKDVKCLIFYHTSKILCFKVARESPCDLLYLIFEQPSNKTF